MTEKEKQIEEMQDSIICAAIVTRVKIDDRSATNLTSFAEEIYAAGYRKQSDTAGEIVDRLKEVLHKHEYRNQTDGVPFYQMNAESFCDEINELAAEYGVEVEK